MKQEYYLVYKGLSRSLPSGEWNNEIEVCREMGWDWESLQAAPAQMADEILLKISARARVEREEQRRSERVKRSR